MNYIWEHIGQIISSTDLDDFVMVKYSMYKEEFHISDFKSRKKKIKPEWDFYYSFRQLLNVSSFGEYWEADYCNTDVKYDLLMYGQVLRLRCDISGDEIIAMICLNHEVDIEFCKKLISANLEDGDLE